MSKFIPVAKMADLDPGAGLSVEAEGRWIGLFNVDGKIYAVDNTCPHSGGPLGEGTITGEIVECPWHGWRYNVRTGERVENQDFSVACYEIQVVGGQIQVLLPEAP